MRSLLVLFAICWAGAATASPYFGPGPDQLVIIFDLDHPFHCGTPEPGTQQDAHLLIWEPTHTVGGWECSVHIDAPSDGLVLGWDLLGAGPINILQPPDFMVGMGVPFPTGTYVHLATVHFYVAGTGWWLFSLSPLPVWLHPSLAGKMCYAAGDDDLNLYPLWPYGMMWGGYPVIVAGLSDGNCNWVVATQERTWGEVKALYR